MIPSSSFEEFSLSDLSESDLFDRFDPTPESHSLEKGMKIALIRRIYLFPSEEMLLPPRDPFFPLLKFSESETPESEFVLQSVSVSAL